MSDEKHRLEQTGVYLHLFNGRQPGEPLEDWGEDGPVLGPFEFVHVPWTSEINLDHDGASLKIVDSTVMYGGFFYSDFSVVSAQQFQASAELQAMHEPFDRTKTFPATKQ